MDNSNQPYTYLSSGFNGFLRRSIDGGQGMTLSGRSSSVTTQNVREVNFDQQQTTGRLGDRIQVGDGAIVDGVKRRFIIVDELGNEVIWLGKIDV